MKTLRYLLVLSALIVLLLTSCDLLGVSIGSRVDSFESELNVNSGRDLQGQFHTAMIGYGGYTPDGVFGGSPLDVLNNNYVISMTGSDQLLYSDIRRWDGTITCSNYAARPIRFLFQQEGTAWYILAIRIESAVFEVGNYSSY